MNHNTKNYSDQGGDRLVIGGELEIKEGATVKGLEIAGGKVSPATKSKLGGVKAEAKGSTDTVEVKIGTDNKLYVPSYPTAPSFPVLDSQPDCVAADLPALVADFNILLSKLRAAGIMAAD